MIKNMRKLPLFAIVLMVLGCDRAANNATTILDGSQLIVCTDSLVTARREVEISELTEDIQIVYLEDSGETPLDLNWCYFSDNYICAKQSGGVTKLFDKSGRFICDIGARGSGEGEYLTANDVLIDEAGGHIFITPYSGSGVLKYTLQGEFVEEIQLGETLYKASLFQHDDSSISLVHLSFQDMDSRFAMANIPAEGEVSYLPAEQLMANLIGKHDIETGYTIDIWSHRNSSDFAFMLGVSDTLYHYSGKENSIKPVLALDIDIEARREYYLMYNELPNHYIITLAGMDGRQYLIEKESLKSYDCTFVNDFMGDMALSTEFQDGYYFSAYKREKLSRLIGKYIESDKCPTAAESTLASINEGLGEGSGYVVMYAKLKSDS